MAHILTNIWVFGWAVTCRRWWHFWRAWKNAAADILYPSARYLDGMHMVVQMATVPANTLCAAWWTRWPSSCAGKTHQFNWLRFIRISSILARNTLTKLWIRHRKSDLILFYCIWECHLICIRIICSMNNDMFRQSMSTPEEVAARTVGGMLRNQRHVFMNTFSAMSATVTP